MNNTQVIGGTLFFIGFITHLRFPNIPLGTVCFFLGAFLTWNGWVASYNGDVDFAIFG
jgi:hypothetical protein